jgi:hypothetical protein
MLATVAELDQAGAPRRLRFEFEQPLEDPSILWVLEEGGRFREYRAPALGGEDRLSP